MRRWRRTVILRLLGGGEAGKQGDAEMDDGRFHGLIGLVLAGLHSRRQR